MGFWGSADCCVAGVTTSNYRKCESRNGLGGSLVIKSYTKYKQRKNQLLWNVTEDVWRWERV